MTITNSQQYGVTDIKPWEKANLRKESWRSSACASAIINSNIF